MGKIAHVAEMDLGFPDDSHVSVNPDNEVSFTRAQYNAG